MNAAAEAMLLYAWQGQDWWGFNNLWKVLGGGLINVRRLYQLVEQCRTAGTP
jgi:hypothetical protein